MTGIQIININNNEWTKIEGFSSKGRRNKAWYEYNNTREIFLFKEPKYFSSTNFLTKEIWTEYLAYKIGTYLGLNIPEAKPATVDEHYGILIKSFLERGLAGLPANELSEASDLLRTIPCSQPHNLKGIKVLQHNELVKDDTWSEYIKMLIFDCIIGNNDRHDENWGLLYEPSIKKFVLAPIYDNASCLTSGDDEYKVEKLLKDDKFLENYIDKGRPPNLYIDFKDYKKYNHFEIIQYLINSESNVTDLIREMLQKDYLSYTKEVLEQIHHTDVPDFYKLSDNRIKLIYKILKIRKKKLEGLI